MIEIAATAKATTAFTTGRTIFTGTGLVNDSLTATDFFPVQGSDSALSSALVGHFDKTKTLGLAGFTIFDNTDGIDLTEGFKLTAQILFTDGVRQIAYEDIHLENTPFLLFLTQN